MRIVHSPGEAERAFESASREGQAYFADASVYVERYLENPWHVEVQVLADSHGNVIHLGERDCTIPRHQKLIEETPSPAVHDELRERIGAIAVDAARAVGSSAWSIEGLLAPDGSYYFMEMNTRLQVEHTCTEEVTGLDQVREQIRVAQGEPLSIRQEDVVLRGHSIECRINRGHVEGLPPGAWAITHYRESTGPGVRVDSGVAEGSEISPLYDPMVAKLIVHDVDRRRRCADAARARRVRDPLRTRSSASTRHSSSIRASSRARRAMAWSSRSSLRAGPKRHKATRSAVVSAGGSTAAWPPSRSTAGATT